MLFNNNNGSFGPLDWLAPTSLATTPFMRGDYVPVLRLVNKDVQQPSELIQFAGIHQNDMGDVADIFKKLGPAVKDFLKAKKEEKIEECKQNPQGCANKLKELVQARKKLKDCMKQKIGRRKRQRCKEELKKLESNILLLEQFQPRPGDSAPPQSSATSMPLPIPAAVPMTIPEEKDNTALYIGGAIIALGVAALVYNMRG